MIIGLSGYARSGKDTVGEMLVEELGFERVSFADKLKEFCDFIFDPVFDPKTWMEGPLFGGQFDAGDWTLLSKSERRPYHQRVGQGARDLINEDIWVDAALPLYGSYQNRNLVVTDVRFPNEYRRIIRLGGHVVRIERAGYGPVNDHESETALDQSFNWDVTLLNDGTLTSLRHKVLHHLIPTLCGKEAR